MDRRQWFRQIIGGAADATAEVVEHTIETALPRQRRPPGAAVEAAFLATCTRCGECQKACPHGAIFTFTAEAGAMLENTPVMAPDRRACHLCEDYPCIQVCEPKALEVPAELPRLGTVEIDRDRCITFKGPECGACAGLCPEGAVALRMVRWRPQLDPSQCVGCGRCISACPVLPSAIALLELE